MSDKYPDTLIIQTDVGPMEVKSLRVIRMIHYLASHQRNLGRLTKGKVEFNFAGGSLLAQVTEHTDLN